MAIYSELSTITLKIWKSRLFSGTHKDIESFQGFWQTDTFLGHTCLLANTNKTASLSSSSANILISSSLASFTRSLSLLSTTKIRPRNMQTRININLKSRVWEKVCSCWKLVKTSVGLHLFLQLGYFFYITTWHFPGSSSSWNAVTRLKDMHSDRSDKLPVHGAAEL